MIDICAEKGWLISVIRIQQLMQCAVQGRWYDESPILTLPQVEELNLLCFKRIAVKLVLFSASDCQIYTHFELNFSRDSLLTLPTLKESVYRNYEKLAAPLREDFEEGQIERIFKVNSLICCLGKFS